MYATANSAEDDAVRVGFVNDVRPAHAVNAPPVGYALHLVCTDCSSAW